VHLNNINKIHLKLTNNELITTIRDSLVSGNQKEAEDAIDGYSENVSLKFIQWKQDNEKKWFQGKNQDWIGLDHKQKFQRFLNDNQ